MRKITARVAAAAVGLTLGGIPAAATAPPVPPDREGPPVSATLPAERSTVTLLTGDRVTFAAGEGEHATVVRIDPADRPGEAPISFRRTVAADRMLVIPSDIAPLVPGRLDTSLFDVVALAAAQDIAHDEDTPGAKRSATPVIVSDAAKLPGAPTARELESIGARAGLLSPAYGSAAGSDTGHRGSSSDTESLLAALDQLPETGAQTRRSGAANQTIVPDAGPRVWLDMPVEAQDADSAPQVGAPQAWDAGYTGAGITVAVLDSGVDTAHPDLTDVVVGEHNFSDTPDAADHLGHGTHVASILAGNGVASEGVNRGISSDADLLNAKVLNDLGDGLISWSIDGLEWAGEQGADVVNMSLGQPWNYTDGSDPASLAVDAASERYDMLVVAAAGNDGPGRATITPPGTAGSALTVAAVDDADEQAWFSSAGPRFGNHALKPDIAAPGDGIIAALATGTQFGEPVGEHYTASSGTSMATPHVAGAAAALAQQRPELSAEQLKSVLMTSAQDAPPNTWQEGAGRLWIPGALGQDVVAEPASLSFGLRAWPQDPVTRTLTYTNPSGADVTLDVDSTLRSDDGRAVPAGTLSISADEVTVPADGSATVDVTIDASLTEGGLFSGEVTATGPDGGTLRTVVGLSDEEESYTLRIKATGRDGAPAGADDWVTIARLDEPDSFFEFPHFPADGTVEYRVPAGTYYVGGAVSDSGSVAAVVAPEVVVDADTTVALDARDAVPVRVNTHRPARPEVKDLTLVRSTEDTLVQDGVYVDPGQDMYATPTDRVSSGEFTLVTEFRLRDPAEPASYQYDLMYVDDGAIPGDLTRDTGPRNTATVRLDHRAFAPGQRITSSTYGRVDDVGFREMPRLVQAPAIVTQYLSTGPGVEWNHGVSPQWFEDDFVWVPQLESAARAYEPGERVTETLLGQVHHAGFSSDPVSPAAASVNRWDGYLSATLPPWVDDAGYAQVEPTDEFTTTRLRLWRDGELLADERGYPSVFNEVPDAESGYRLRLDMTRDAAWWPLSTEVHTDWWFSSGAVGAQATALPLLQIDYGLRLDELNRGDRAERMRIDVGHQKLSDGGDVAGLKLWWSADDGATWEPARVRDRGDGRFVVKVKVPDDTEHVSLRAEAWDDAGSRISETVLRAYQVAP